MIEIAQPKASNIRIYEFAARLDPECINAVGDQIHKARVLYNDLIASIRGIVAEQQAYILERAGDDAKSLEMQINSLTEQFLTARANQDEIGMKQAAQERHQLRLTLWKMLSVARKECKKEIAEKFLSRIGKRTECDTYKIRCNAVAQGLGWATANEILDNALDAFKKTMTKGQAPRFAIGSEKTQDSLTLQFTAAGGLPSNLIFTDRTTGEIALTLPKAGKYGEFRFRLGSAKEDQWARGTWLSDRPVPSDAFIGLARLVRRKIGKDLKYWLQVQAKLPDEVSVSTLQKKSLVALHMGWAKDEDSRNVAGISECGDPSVAEVIKLPVRVEKLLNQSSVAQSRRDINLEEVVPTFNVWEPVGMPEEIEAEILAIKKLKTAHISQSRLHRLCWAIKHADIQVPEWLEIWRKRDKMDHQETAHIARRARNIRKSFYREIASKLAREFSSILIEKPNLKDAAELVGEQTGEKTEMVKKARSGRVVAALYEFDSALKQAFEKNGGAILVLSGEKTASQCSICGDEVKSIEDTPDAVVCSGCGAMLNKKQNGAANAYQLASEVANDLVLDYHLEARKQAFEKLEKMKGKLKKMSDARKNKRTVLDISMQNQ